MLGDPTRKVAAKEVKAAQKQFEQDSKAAREARRKAFAKAQKEGLSPQEIGELSGVGSLPGRTTIELIPSPLGGERCTSFRSSSRS
jgi:hypothetical protein